MEDFFFKLFLKSETIFWFFSADFEVLSSCDSAAKASCDYRVAPYLPLLSEWNSFRNVYSLRGRSQRGLNLGETLSGLEEVEEAQMDKITCTFWLKISTSWYLFWGEKKSVMS